MIKKEKKSVVSALLNYAGDYKGLTFLGMILSAVSMFLSMIPYICIWLATKDLIAVAPDWTQAQGIMRYGWLAFGFSMGGYCSVLYRTYVYPSGSIPHGFEYS